MQNPFVSTDERHYSIDAAARQLKMPPRALVERIDSGKVKVKFNGHRNYISASEVTRVSAELRREAEAAEQTEQERAALDRQHEDGRHITRLMSEAQDIASRYGYDPTQD